MKQGRAGRLKTAPAATDVNRDHPTRSKSVCNPQRHQLPFLLPCESSDEHRRDWGWKGLPPVSNLVAKLRHPRGAAIRAAKAIPPRFGFCEFSLDIPSGEDGHPGACSWGRRFLRFPAGLRTAEGLAQEGVAEAWIKKIPQYCARKVHKQFKRFQNPVYRKQDGRNRQVFEYIKVGEGVFKKGFPDSPFFSATPLRRRNLQAAGGARRPKMTRKQLTERKKF